MPSLGRHKKMASEPTSTQKDGMHLAAGKVRHRKRSAHRLRKLPPAFNPEILLRKRGASSPDISHEVSNFSESVVADMLETTLPKGDLPDTEFLSDGDKVPELLDQPTSEDKNALYLPGTEESYEDHDEDEKQFEMPEPLGYGNHFTPLGPAEEQAYFDGRKKEISNITRNRQRSNSDPLSRGSSVRKLSPEEIGIKVPNRLWNENPLDAAKESGSRKFDQHTTGGLAQTGDINYDYFSAPTESHRSSAELKPMKPNTGPQGLLKKISPWKSSESLPSEPAVQKSASSGFERETERSSFKVQAMPLEKTTKEKNIETIQVWTEDRRTIQFECTPETKAIDVKKAICARHGLKLTEHGMLLASGKKSFEIWDFESPIHFRNQVLANREMESPIFLLAKTERIMRAAGVNL